MVESTTVRVKAETWRQLHERKSIGESMDDVVQELLEASDD